VEFEQYVEARGPSLLRLAVVLTGDHHLAQDLVQTALAQAYGRWSSVCAADHPDAYVRRIMVNAHLGWRRRRWFGERPAHTADGVAQLSEGTSVDHADASAARDEMRRALATLPVRARTVLVLRYYADLDDAAIAELVGVSVSGVRSTASRALATLRHKQSAALTSPTPTPTANRSTP
jgi:RNA polymerase sigma-70 factor (sigma-E family)